MHYIVLYPQNGDRIMTIDYVTSLHPIDSPLALLLYACSPPQFYFVPGMGAICMSVGISQKPLFKPGKFQGSAHVICCRGNWSCHNDSAAIKR